MQEKLEKAVTETFLVQMFSALFLMGTHLDHNEFE